MSLRWRFFLLLGGLVSLLATGQWLLYRALAQAVGDDVRTVAFKVGEQIVSGFVFQTNESQEEGAPPRTRVMVVAPRVEGELEPGKAPEDDTKSAGTTPHRIEVRKELRWEGNEATETTTVKHLLPSDAHVVKGKEGARDLLFLKGPSLERAIPIPQDDVASTLASFRSRLLLGNLLLLALGIAAAALLAQRMSRPLGELAVAAERVGRGELGLEVPVERRDELGRALASFNQMSHRLGELAAENRRLAEQQHLSELGEVARGLAHTLRNPLNALGLSLEQLAANGAPSGTAREQLLAASRRQIRRMDGALRSFLALASAGGAAPEPIDLAQLAREVALEALQDAGGRVRVEVESAPGERHELLAVPAEVKAMLQALVVNACEASPEGERVTLRIRTLADRSGVLAVEVLDRGAGVPEAIRARLFEPHTTTKPHGSGMGLYLAQRLAAGRYGGRLELAPREGGGTVARLELRERAAAAGPGSSPESAT